jgi:hypothetical protein
MEVEIRAKFEIEEPSSHRLPAYEGSQSIQGIARGLVLATHFAATGVVRHRAPFSSDLQVYIEPPRRGSLEAIYQIVSDPAVQVAGTLGISVTGAFLYDFMKTIFSRSVGKSTDPSNAGVQEIDDTRSGDMDAIEPSLRLGHKAINYGANNIVIIQGDNNVVKLDHNTKEYVERSELSQIVEEQDLSVGSFNANSGYGRVYFHDLAKTVPFIIHKEAEPGTRGAISYSLDRYANHRPSDVPVRFIRVQAADGRTKSIVIVDAKKFTED